MHISWKDYQINQNHQHELRYQAEQEHLAQIARQNQQGKNTLKVNLNSLGLLVAAIQSLSLRPR